MVNMVEVNYDIIILIDYKTKSVTIELIYHLLQYFFLLKLDLRLVTLN